MNEWTGNEQPSMVKKWEQQPSMVKKWGLDGPGGRGWTDLSKKYI